MSKVTIKVTPDTLRTKSGEIENNISNISRLYEDIKRCAEASVGHWEGKASDKFRKYVKSIDNDMQNVLKRLREHPRDLQSMAGVYAGKEEDIVEQINTLPTEVIK